MSKRILNVVVMLVIASLSLVPLAGVGCARPATPTPPAGEEYKPDKWTWYLSGDFSGPMGPSNACMIPAAQDFCEWVNSQGGIRGVPVDFEARDNGCDIAQGVAAYEYFRSLEPKPVIGSFHPSFVAEALTDRVNEDEIVNWMNSPGNSTVFPVGYNIACVMSYPGALAATMDYVAENWKGGDIKLGLLTVDNSFGRSIFDDEVRRWCAERKGLDLVAEEVFQMTDTDVSTQVIRLKGKGVNWVFDNTGASLTPMISRSIDSLGLLAQDFGDTTPGKMHRATDIWGLDEACVRLGGGPGGVLDGLIGVRACASWHETDCPGIKILTESFERHDRPADFMGHSYVFKWSKWYFITEIVGEIVDDYGWEGVTGERVRDKILNSQGFDAMGLQHFSYTPTCPYTTSGRIYQVQDGKPLPITGWVELPDLRPADYRK